MKIKGLAQSFIEQADKTPDRIFARTTDGTELGFRALSDAADAMIAWLAEHGVRPVSFFFHGVLITIVAWLQLASLEVLFGAGFLLGLCDKRTGSERLRPLC